MLTRPEKNYFGFVEHVHATKGKKEAREYLESLAMKESAPTFYYSTLQKLKISDEDIEAEEAALAAEAEEAEKAAKPKKK